MLVCSWVLFCKVSNPNKPCPSFTLFFCCSCARGPPQFSKKSSENRWANEIFHLGSHQFRESLRELLRELWFSYCSSRGMLFREWNFVCREWNFEFRELLRGCPGTLRELRQWHFPSESFFPEIRVVTRLLSCCQGPRKASKITKDFLSLPNAYKPKKKQRKDPFYQGHFPKH